MKTLKQYIKESLDYENLYFKMNIFFQKDEIQRQLFNGYFVDGDFDKLLRDNFDYKGFVDFIFDDLSPELDKDYKYQLDKIRKVLQSKHYNPL